ncbi:Hsp70 family protein [Gimesia algae]|uniref:Chaperone protein DnaK n=1 Tax=Gimesia algae TaxID=2527971 RepID=A0A517VHM2_9PLAN|nr:Hsp70 family protein [Gimesia algae]QDT92514.1 Chaperone protein DnaK [Gimesia algae]
MTDSNKIAVGIDLGTTFSVVAYLNSSGVPTTIPNTEGDLTTPSVVLFDDSNVVIGKEAVRAAPLEAESIANHAKREMGNSHYSRRIAGQNLPPEVVQSLILEKLKHDAESVIGPFDDVVITVPAFFNEPRRKATEDAGKLAGLNVIDIINEPTAAAIAYGFKNEFLSQGGESQQKEIVLVYDLGGGTFDVTLMEINGKNYNTIATAGDVFLGGIDWDRRIVDFIAEEYKKKYRGLDPRDNLAGIHRLMREAEDAKRALSAREQTTISFEHAGQGVRLSLTREMFESLTADLLRRTIFTISQMIKDAGLDRNQITRLLLIGGSSRMPVVKKMLEQETGLKPEKSLPVDEVVAHGAAIYAGLLQSESIDIEQSIKISNVNSHSLGVLALDQQTNRKKNSVIIPRNTPLPVIRGKRFFTVKENQKRVVVKVIEGGDATGKNATIIGKCIVDNLPKGLPAQSEVLINFSYAQNGRLTVYTRLPQAEREVQVTIERVSGLDESAMREWGRRLDKPGGLFAK